MNDKKFIKIKVRKSLQKLFGNTFQIKYEFKGLNLLSSMVSSILITGQSNLQQMALGNPERKDKASKVKQYKRVLLNQNIDSKTYFLPYIKPLLSTLAASGKLVFSIDGSSVGRGCICLMFSVIYKDKAIPVVWKVYKAKKGHLPETAHRALLGELAQIVPENCRIVITGDGEFDSCNWQQDILDYGWDYVLRTSKNVWIEEQEWDSFKPAYVPLEAGQNLYFEGVNFTKKKFVTNFFIWHGKGQKDPIYLVTNLDYEPEIKQFYKKRFNPDSYREEPFFRDQKSKGFNIQKSGLMHPERLEKLLLATCLAYILAIMASAKALKSKFYSQIARKDGAFLSLFQIGYLFILLLVDLRQWRAFSWKYDMLPEMSIQQNCVPF